MPDAVLLPPEAYAVFEEMARWWKSSRPTRRKPPRRQVVVGGNWTWGLTQSSVGAVYDQSGILTQPGKVYVWSNPVDANAQPIEIKYYSTKTVGFGHVAAWANGEIRWLECNPVPGVEEPSSG